MAYLEVEGDVTGLVLPSGHVALIDADDAPLVSQYRWFIHHSRNKLYVIGYRIGGPTRLKNARLHRVVLGIDGEVDHINGDGLDNRKANLRPATRRQNICNTPGRARSTSPYKGVSWVKRAGKWRARIRVDGKYQQLGLFTDPWAAAETYNAAAFEAWGEYAWLNTRQDG